MQARTEQNLARYFNLKNPKTKNIPTLSVGNQGLDSKLERVNGLLRDRECVTCGFHNRDTPVSYRMANF
ncbi:MAG: hypothetical protein WBE34_03440 [Candidatus Nitrosopolaris sp.]